MEYLINKTLILKTDHEHAGLYKWSLRERDDKGIESDSDWVPFWWSFVFEATSLEAINVIEVELDRRSDKSCATSRRRIRGKFATGWTSEDGSVERQVSFEIFGTGREIRYFALDIYQADDSEQKIRQELDDDALNKGEESCHLSAFPSYESEGPELTREIAPDHAGFEVFLKRERFAELISLIEKRSIDSVVLTVRHVNGVYAHWTPTIVTRHARLLTKENEIEIADGVDIEVPRIGQVGEFNLTFTTRTKLLNQRTPTQEGEQDEARNDGLTDQHEYLRSQALERLTQPTKRSLSERDHSNVKNIVLLILAGLLILGFLTDP